MAVRRRGTLGALSTRQVGRMLGLSVIDGIIGPLAKPGKTKTKIADSPCKVHREPQRVRTIRDNGQELSNGRSSMVGLVPSILAADFTRLGEQVRDAAAAGADRLQVDVMDGHFVPNISMGPAVLQAVRDVTSLPLEVHLMITNPEDFVSDFARAGADVIIVHQEVCYHLHRVIQQIKAEGKRAGVALNPATPIAMLDEILPFLVRSRL